MANVELEWWWPSPEAFNDLEVTDIEDGWQLSAPDDTELGEWLAHWSQDEEHHALFQEVFIKTLTDHAHFVLENFDQNGKNEDVPVGGQTDREQAEEHLAGELP